MRRSGRALLAGALLVLGLMAACRAFPALAARWQAGVALPALRALHRFTAGWDAPALEVVALALPACALLALILHRPRMLAGLLLIVFGMYALLWYPGYWAAPERGYPEPDAARLEALCVELIDGLDGAEARALTSAQALSRAGGIAGIAGVRVKPARHPEWMRALRIAGLFAPWTGEAVVDPGASPYLLPFTAVHELMHLSGIADEGAANIAAWQRCLAHGGAFADSARLWALRYALRALNRADAAACLRMMDRVGAELRPLCQPMASAAPPLLRRACAALGIGNAVDNYDALVRWLAEDVNWGLYGRHQLIIEN